MTKYLLICLSLLLTINGSAAFAEKDHHHGHDHDVDHYQAKTIHNKDEAVKILNASIQEIKAIMKGQDLGALELENVHEISYTLEAAIDKLISLKSFPMPKLEDIDEAVQAIHHASENHEEEKVRSWLAKLDSSTSTLNNKVVKKKSGKKIYEISIKDHRFTPEEIHVPAGEKIKLIVYNNDPTPEEFESDDFRREKIIAGNSKGTIFVGPLKPGKYHFFGEFNLDTANGYLIAE